MDGTNQAPRGENLSAKLEGFAQMLCSDAEGAATGASESLDVVPGQTQALLLLVGALNVIATEEGTLEILSWMSEAHPKLASLQHEFGIALARLGRTQEAIGALSRTVQLEPGHAPAWKPMRVTSICP
jgi:Flp pilus assembly protein TadD